jgi:hypothetical protein
MGKRTLGPGWGPKPGMYHPSLVWPFLADEEGVVPLPDPVPAWVTTLGGVL